MSSITRVDLVSGVVNDGAAASYFPLEELCCGIGGVHDVGSVVEMCGARFDDVEHILILISCINELVSANVRTYK